MKHPNLLFIKAIAICLVFTIVSPITIYRDEIVFQLDNNRNVFNKLIDRVLKKYDFIKYMSYWKSDGSCPNTLTIWFKEGVMK